MSMNAPLLRPIPNPNIREIADGFFDAAVILLNQELQIPRPFTSVVNTALALELYLKSLDATLQLGDPGNYGKSKPPITTHAPLDLFKALGPRERDHVLASYAGCSLATAHPSLEDLFAKYQKTFIEGRYIFEAKYDVPPFDDPDTFFALVKVVRAAVHSHSGRTEIFDGNVWRLFIGGPSDRGA